MSASPAGDEIRYQAAPIQPPVTSNPLAPFMPLMVPGLLAVFVVLGVIYGAIPVWNMVDTADNNFEKMRKDAVAGYSHTYQGPVVAPPIYVPGNNPNGPFTPPIP
jgi:hypothetical protein